MAIGNKTLRFMVVPNLHWPDTMYTYIEEEQILVTCDSFGSHYGFHDLLVSKVTDTEGYMRATKYYFDCIIGPFKSYMLKALQRVRDIDVSMICPGHGPILDEKIDFMLNTYEKWCETINPNTKKTVVIPYVSAYGYTGMLAEKIAEGIKDSGDVDVHIFDMVETEQETVMKELEFADGFLLGTPTIVGEALKPIWDLTTSMFPPVHGEKLAGAFGSYGWSGEGVPHIIERLKQLRMKVIDDGFRVRFKPGQADLTDAYEYGYNFGCVLQEKENTKKKSGKSQLVKCLVCGEIFDSSLEICPVCGVGKENFVPVEVEENQFTRNTNDFYVIIGNGAAGLNAAKAIRERDKTGSILMISNEPYSTYHRPMLTKSIMAELDPVQIGVEDESWYEDNHIYQVLDKKVTSVDVKEKEVIMEDGSKVKYTKLIYAAGSEPFMPPISGNDKPEVLTIRRLSDTQKIAKLLTKVKNVVLIGGGVLGLEAAWEMKKAGCQVTVLELSPILMGRQLDKNAAELLKRIAQDQDINIYTGVTIDSIEGEEHVTGVKLGDGTILPAEMVLVSTGVRANVDVAKTAGVEIDRAVVVNSRMETSVSEIYACGDCAQYDGVNYAIWPQAVEEGKVAGANAAGDVLEYTPVSAALNFHGMNTALFAAGDTGKNPDLIYKTVEFMDAGKKHYEKLYFMNNRLCGVILIGDVSRMGELSEALQKKSRFQEVMK